MRGGTRPGAGRPQGSVKPEKKVKVGISLRPDQLNWLRKCDNTNKEIEKALDCWMIMRQE